ncbi:zinc finger protein ZFP2-like isoform X1 [Achroia grisella]|uniref:zinc finger protein ZFP2-like isoform X1 n=1 Tax=Achroia grisella TaxID=688607 RepID=UPI0027D2B72C|nr:zinc finger protein ZFP2-like isoform X1 [Achroia grisella]
MDTTMNHGMCRCCASEGTFKNLSNAYQWMGQEEIYSDMLKECFDISLTTAEPGEEGGICEVCITQLRNAANFKKQVQHTEVQFKKCLQDKLFKSDLIKVEATNLDDGDDSDNDNNLSDNFSGNEFDMAIKKEKEDPKPKKRVATRASTSRAKKSKVDDGEPSTKRKQHQESINIEIRDVTTKKVGVTELNNYKDQDEDYIIIIGNPNDISKNANQKDGASCSVVRNENVNIAKSDKAHSSINKRKNDAVIKEKHFNNIKAILENSNATIIRHRGGIGYACGYCSEQFPDPTNLKKHSLETHINVNQCYILNYKSMCDYIVKLDITALCCKLCDTNIDSLDNFMEHLQKIHDIKIFTDINNHIIPFKFDSKTLTCAVCANGITFYKFKTLLEHMRVHCRNYVCEECNEGFINSTQLRVHKNFHEAGNYPCDTCGKVLTNIRTLKAHVRAHIFKSKLVHKCGYCSELFQFSHQKYKHLEKVHGVDIVPIQCQACDKTFMGRSGYSQHIKIHHLMEQSYKCTQCDKTYVHFASLKEHEKSVHEGIKPYKCDVCLKKYTRRITWMQHIRIHTNDRRHICKICGQAFVAKVSWRGHMRSKHGEII